LTDFNFFLPKRIFFVRLFSGNRCGVELCGQSFFETGQFETLGELLIEILERCRFRLITLGSTHVSKSIFDVGHGSLVNLLKKIGNVTSKHLAIEIYVVKSHWLKLV
jgi:hypothetical protein